MLEHRDGDERVEMAGPILRQRMQIGDDVDINTGVHIRHQVIAARHMRKDVNRMGGPALDRLFRAEFEDARLASESRRGGDEGVTRRAARYIGA